MPRRIDPELRARAVRLLAEHRPEYPTKTAAAVAVAKQLSVWRESVRRWMAQAQVDAGESTPPPGGSTGTKTAACPPASVVPAAEHKQAYYAALNREPQPV